MEAIFWKKLFFNNEVLLGFKYDCLGLEFMDSL